MNYTTNYNLNKPERSEQFNIDHWNDNSDTIDTQMHTNAVNIATNASDISSIVSNLTTNKATDSSSTYYKLMQLIYPVGSIYWSSKSTNPANLFGGTWVQIKDKFIWAKGDSDTVNATGGANTVSLTTSNLPSHTHSFTPSGTVSAHAHGLNNHTHSFTPSGTVSSHSHTINSGNTSSSGTKTTAGIRHSGSTGGMSGNSTGTFGNQGFKKTNGSESVYSGFVSPTTTSLTKTNSGSTTGNTNNGYTMNIEHTHTLPASYIYGSTDSTQPTFTGSAGTTGGNSGNTTSVQPTFTGSAGTTGVTGGGEDFSIMPPFVIKYCWERTA